MSNDGNANVANEPQDRWPAAAYTDCACPHCGNIDKYQLANVREWNVEARLGECTVCFGEYSVAANEGIVTVEKLPQDRNSYLIRHHYDMGDQGVTVEAPDGFDARRAALYMLFHAEQWFGGEKMVSNLGIAAGLVTLYGCKHAPRNSRGEVIDLHNDRAEACGKAPDLMRESSLHREGLKEFLSHHMCG